jgi:integrase
MFAQAVDDGILASNPAVGVLRRDRGGRGYRRAPRFLRRDELARLLAACRSGAPRWYPFVLVLARTGMRLGEAAALRWEDVDLEQGFAEERSAFWRGRVQTPKSGRTRRVDLSRHLVAVLRELRASRRAAAMCTGAPPTPWLFATPDGRAPTTDNFRRRAWRRIIRAAAEVNAPDLETI